ncbi:MAG TPA: MSMEG_1061 family FMN-dependent PPOX-type flavoprotein [Gaiellaceae bacterium]|nr:MSMEG_1061 family FMN-dependent PPOX-type flavoprotein [Gaiellaceae bacterium]
MSVSAALGFDHVVSDLEELVELCGLPDEAVRSKVIDRLDRHCRDFIARSPLFLLGTCDAAGRCDVSPRGGPPGFVEVLDDRRLAFGNAKGNRLIDSFRNIRETGRVGMLFLIPGLGETLRVNGRACLTRDPELLARHEIQPGKPPAIAVGVEVEEAFLHCAKAFIRSTLWDPATWPSRDGLARPAQIWKDHMALPDLTVASVEELVEESYGELY